MTLKQTQHSQVIYLDKLSIMRKGRISFSLSYTVKLGFINTTTE